MKNIILTSTGVLWLFLLSVTAGAGHVSGGCGSAVPCPPSNGGPIKVPKSYYQIWRPAKSNSGSNGKGGKSGQTGPNNRKINSAYSRTPLPPQSAQVPAKRDVRQLFTRQSESAFIHPQAGISAGADPLSVDIDAEGEFQTGQGQNQG